MPLRMWYRGGPGPLAAESLFWKQSLWPCHPVLLGTALEQADVQWKTQCCWGVLLHLAMSLASVSSDASSSCLPPTDNKMPSVRNLVRSCVMPTPHHGAQHWRTQKVLNAELWLFVKSQSLNCRGTNLNGSLWFQHQHAPFNSVNLMSMKETHRENLHKFNKGSI